MNRMQRCLVTVMTATSLFAGLGTATAAPQEQKEKKEHKEKEQKEQKGPKDKEKKPKKQHHKNGKNLVGDKIKHNGRHTIDKKADFTTDVDVKDGKIAGVHVKHAKKGDVPVTKYKTNKKMAMSLSPSVQYASLDITELQEYVGTMWIGYSYIDDYGEEEIYWFPYDMILDGDTGAIEYVPADYY